MRLAFYLLILGGAAALLVVNHDVGAVFGLPAQDFARLIIGATFAMSVGAALLRRFQGGLGPMFHALAFWGATFVVLMAAYSYQDELTAIGQRTYAYMVPGTAMETGVRGEAMVARGRDGHFHVRAEVDGGRVDFMVDTGASSVVLTEADARKAGIDVSRLLYDVEVATANGRAKAAEVMLAAVTVGEIQVTRVRAMVARPGQLETSLLGNSFLSRLKSFTVEGSKLTMRQ